MGDVLDYSRTMDPGGVYLISPGLWTEGDVFD